MEGGRGRPSSQHSAPEQSAELRDRLLAGLNELTSSDDAGMWAHRSLAEKNRLTAADAQRVEDAFQAHIKTFASDAEDQPETGGQSAEPKPRALLCDLPKPASRKHSPAKRIARGIDKSALALPEPRRVRDRDHVRYVAKQPCLICGRQPSDPHHLRFAQSRALGRKVSDEFTVPLCRGHHREVHGCGDEAAWWSEIRIDAAAAARVLWLKTHPLPAMMEKTIDRDTTSVAAVSAEVGNERGGPSVGKRSKINPTKPIPAGNA